MSKYTTRETIIFLATIVSIFSFRRRLTHLVFSSAWEVFLWRGRRYRSFSRTCWKPWRSHISLVVNKLYPFQRRVNVLLSEKRVWKAVWSLLRKKVRAWTPGPKSYLFPFQKSFPYLNLKPSLLQRFFLFSLAIFSFSSASFFFFLLFLKAVSTLIATIVFVQVSIPEKYTLSIYGMGSKSKNWKVSNIDKDAWDCGALGDLN